MHRGLPQVNTKLVLILTRPWALPTIGPGLHEFPLNLSAPIRGLRDPFVDVILATSSTCLHMICQLNAHEIRITFYDHKVTIDRV